MKSRILALAALLNLAAPSLFPQISAWAGQSPKEVVERFCELDAQGKLLSPQGSRETASFFVSPYQWSKDRTIVIVSDYLVSSYNTHRNRSGVTVDYRRWGNLDSSLSFTREEGAIPNNPIQDREYYELVFTNRHNELRENELKAVAEGPPSWRIEVSPSGPRVNINSLINYLSNIHDQLSEVVLKENADKSLIALERLVIEAPNQPPRNLRKTPVEVVKQYIQMDLKGKRLTSNGLNEMGRLLVQAGPPGWKNIEVTKEIAAGNAAIRNGNRAEVSVVSFRWGRLDPQTALFEKDSTSGVKLIGNYDLALVNEKGELVPDVSAAGDVNGSLEWRISRPLLVPRISVETAIGYVTKIRDETDDPAIKKTASQTLAKLRNLH